MVNARWHKSHVMPKNPTLEQRIKWHEAHAKACGCRPMPPNILSRMKREATKSGRGK